METLYFSWQGDPEVIAPNSDESGYLAFFMKPEDKDWSPAGMGKISDWYENGSTLSKSEFEVFFGILM